MPDNGLKITETQFMGMQKDDRDKVLFSNQVKTNERLHDLSETMTTNFDEVKTLLSYKNNEDRNEQRKGGFVGGFFAIVLLGLPKLLWDITQWFSAKGG